jgi:hypothetical protein
MGIRGKNPMNDTVPGLNLRISWIGKKGGKNQKEEENRFSHGGFAAKNLGLISTV